MPEGRYPDDMVVSSNKSFYQTMLRSVCFSLLIMLNLNLVGFAAWLTLVMEARARRRAKRLRKRARDLSPPPVPIGMGYQPRNSQRKPSHPPRLR